MGLFGGFHLTSAARISFEGSRVALSRFEPWRPKIEGFKISLLGDYNMGFGAGSAAIWLRFTWADENRFCMANSGNFISDPGF